MTAFKERGLLPDKALTISTIDASQGREFDAVILTMGNTKCADLTRFRPRGNVAISRGRNITILLASERFLHATRPQGDPQQLDYIPAPEPTQRCVRFWGLWMLSPVTKVFRAQDGPSKQLLRRLQSYHDLLKCGASPTVNTTVALAKATIERIDRDADLHLPDHERQLLAKTLFLKRNYWTITSLHMKIYGAACSCDMSSFRDVLNIYTSVPDHKERNKQLCVLFNINFSDKTVDPRLIEKIQAMYPVLKKPVNSKRRRI